MNGATQMKMSYHVRALSRNSLYFWATFYAEVNRSGAQPWIEQGPVKKSNVEAKSKAPA
jgi:hypothetical protein